MRTTTDTDMDYKSYVTDFEKLFRELDKKEPSRNRPVSENSSERTVQLYRFLCDCYGKHIISGQQMLYPDEFEDIVYYRETGDLPAIKGFDFMDETGRHEYYDQMTRALRWVKESGGILTLCWHWYMPNDIDDFSKGFSFYSENSSFDLVKAVTPGTREYELVIDDIDCIAKLLMRFSEEGIPVLWRPLHESNGSWFWWGKRDDETREAYKKLWYIMFDRLENFYRLDNLIWVWNGQDKDMLVHPATFDISGDDIYPPDEGCTDHSTQSERYNYMLSYIGDKPVTLSECKFIPDPILLKKEGVKWLWWLPWWGIFVYKFDENHNQIIGSDGYPVLNEDILERNFLRRTFADDYVITLKKLPWFDGDKYKLPSHVAKLEILPR